MVEDEERNVFHLEKHGVKASDLFVHLVTANQIDIVLVLLNTFSCSLKACEREVKFEPTTSWKRSQDDDP